MKKINLKGISEILSEKEMKNVMGGSGTGRDKCNDSCKSDSDCDTVCKKCTSVAGGGFGTFCQNP